MQFESPSYKSEFRNLFQLQKPIQGYILTSFLYNLDATYCLSMF